MSAIKKVGIRSLKAKLSEHISSNEPIAVTKNGRTVGFYLPVGDEEEEITLMLDRANSKLQELRREQ